MVRTYVGSNRIDRFGSPCRLAWVDGMRSCFIYMSDLDAIDTSFARVPVTFAGQHGPTGIFIVVEPDFSRIHNYQTCNDLFLLNDAAK